MTLESCVATSYLVAGLAVCQPEADFFSFVPASDIPSTSSTAMCSFDYKPSGSTWGPEAVEENVFFARIANQDEGQHAWKLGIGRGGQIYSLVGPFGESVPPQAKYRAESKSIWVDEVWQNVAVAGDKINRDTVTEEGAPATRGEDHVRSMKFFIHQAGSYRHDKALAKVFYAPPLAYSWDAVNSRYAHLSCGQQAHIPSIHKSGLLNYTVYRDLGDGVIEVTYVMVNFGKDTYNYINMPWGGVRTSNLPQQWVSEVNGDLTPLPLDHLYGNGTRDLKDTGGFFAWSQNRDDSAYAMSIVFGQDRHFSELQERGIATNKPSRIKFGISSKAGAPSTVARDYTVFFVGTYPDVKPGDVFYWRNFFVIGSLADVRSASKELNPKTDYGFITLKEKDSPRIHYHVDPGNPSRIVENGSEAATPGFSLYAWPVSGSQPVLLMKDKATGKYFISTDPYVNAKTYPFKNPYPPGHAKHDTYQNQTCYQHYLTTEYVKILGFTMPDEASLAAIRKAIGDADFCRL